MPEVNIGGVVSVDVAQPREGWKSYRFNIHNFEFLDAMRESYLETPIFDYNGDTYVLRIYPGGNIFLLMKEMCQFTSKIILSQTNSQP